MAASFFEQSDTHHPVSLFDNLWNEDFVLAASCVSCCQLSQLEVSPYQEALLARGACHQHQGQIPDGQMEQVMGYTGAIGTMLMDEMAGVCGRAEERFTGIQMDTMVNNMNGLLELNCQMIQHILQLRMSQVHGWGNLIVVNDSSDEDVLDTALVPVPVPVEHRLVPIAELTESVESSKEEDDSGDEVWEVSCEEFVGSSPEL